MIISGLLNLNRSVELQLGENGEIRPNIVKYKGFGKTHEFLCIILEYGQPFLIYISLIIQLGSMRMVHCTIFREFLRELGCSVHLLGAGRNHSCVIHRDIKGKFELGDKYPKQEPRCVDGISIRKNHQPRVQHDLRNKTQKQNKHISLNQKKNKKKKKVRRPGPIYDTQLHK